MKSILVIDENGRSLSSTYEKRAKQMVRDKRAQWVKVDTIRIFTTGINAGVPKIENEKGVGMMYASNDRQGEGEIDSKGYVPVDMGPYAGFSEEQLYNLAKKRVEDRQGLIIHIISYVTVNIFLFFIAVVIGRGFWNFYVLGGWGIGLVCHIAAYIFDANQESVYREYEKLKGKR
jgi:hypothetical protein